MRRDCGRGSIVEPVSHDDRRLAERHRGNRLYEGRDPGRGAEGLSVICVQKVPLRKAR
jgi:hypothetical protein